MVDLARPEQEILAGMSASVRRYVRQAVKLGLVAEVCGEAEFADEYYAQLTEVFARQGLVPTYGVDRVRALIRALGPAGQVLLLRVRTDAIPSLATAIVVGRGRTAVLWGMASYRSHLGLHPNEPLHFEAMRHWRAHGASRYDMVGGGDYKAAYGGSETVWTHLHRSRFPGLPAARSAYRSVVRVRQIMVGRRRRGRREGDP